MSRIYRFGIGILGLGQLVWLLLVDPLPHPWATVAFFAFFSWVVKRIGFRITADVTHSLVNLVDVAALLLFGPLLGAIVSALSSGFYIVSWGLRQRRMVYGQAIELALFDAGVKALMALGSGNLYLALGGDIPPGFLDASNLIPTFALFVTWFSLDHLFWTGNFLMEGGLPRARRFLKQVLRPSLLVELLPLPFSLILVAGWLSFSGLTWGLLVVLVILAAFGVRMLVGEVRRSKERLQVVSLLNQFSAALVEAQLNEPRLAALLHDYISRVIPVNSFVLLLNDERDTFYTATQTGNMLPLPPVIIKTLVDRLQADQVAIPLPDLSLTTLATLPSPLESPNRGWNAIPGEEASHVRAAVVPLALGDSLFGMALVSSTRPVSAEEIQTIRTLSTQAAITLENARHYRREQWRALQLQTIADVAHRVAAIIELDELLNQVVELVKETFDYYHVQIYLVDQERNQVVFRAGSGPIGQTLALHPPRFPISHSDRGIITWVAAQGEPMLVNDVEREPRYIREERRLLPKTRAELAVPLMVERRVLGVLDVQGDEMDCFDEDDLFTLQTLAHQVSLAIEDARLYAAQREETWVTTALLQVAEAVSSLNRLSDVLETVSRITPVMTGAGATAIYLWRDTTQRFEPAESHGLTPEGEATFRTHAVLADEFPLLMETIQRQTVQTAAADEETLVPPELAPALTPAGETPSRLMLVAAPLLAQGESVGVMLLSVNEATPFEERQRALVGGIAQQAAVAIQAARFYAAQRDEAWITTALLQVAEAVASRNDLDEVLHLITRLTTMLAEVERCAVYLWNPQERRLEPTAAYGLPDALEEGWQRRAILGSEWASLPELVEAPGPIVVGHGNNGMSPPPLSPFFRSPLVISPLHAHGRFLGLLVVDMPPQRHPEAFELMGRNGNGPEGTAILNDRLRAILSGVARQLAIAVENARLYDEALENERRTQELRLARQLQSALLPEYPPSVAGYDLAGYWMPAREVAGDFYDFFRVGSDRIGVAIADVADKGMAAALFMVLTRSALRESIWGQEHPGAAMTETNRRVTADASGGMFVTCSLTLLDPASGQVTMANAGHLPPIVYDAAGGGMASLAPRNLPLGILDNQHYAEVQWQLAPGSFMVLYTDGVTDATDANTQLFGLQRLSEVVWANRQATAHGMIAAINAAVADFVGGTVEFDDQTIVVIKRLGDRQN